MEFTIRRARREDCPAMLELIRELAVFERAPEEVTVNMAHFEESGFGERPIWWAFVACAGDKGAEAAELSAEANQPVVAVQDPLLAQLIQDPAPASSAVGEPGVPEISSEIPGDPLVQLDEPVKPAIPEPVMEAMPLMMESHACENVVGFALYYIRYSTWKGQRMYLEDILVTEGWRCKGVGTALMDALIGVAKAEGLHGISWQVLRWNEDAIKFYERYTPRIDGEWLNVAIDV